MICTYQQTGREINRHLSQVELNGTEGFLNLGALANPKGPARIGIKRY